MYFIDRHTAWISPVENTGVEVITMIKNQRQRTKAIQDLIIYMAASYIQTEEGIMPIYFYP